MSFPSKSSNLTTSQSDYLSQSLNDYQQYHPSSRTRTMSESEEISTDIIADLSTIPRLSTKRNRRFSDSKPSVPIQTQKISNERRNSTSQVNLSSFLPYPFRSNKHQYKTMKKDETSATVSQYNNDTIMAKVELPPSLKSRNTNMNGSLTNLSMSSEHLSSYVLEDSQSSTSSTSSVFTFDGNQSEPRSTETIMLHSQIPLLVGRIYRDEFFDFFHINYCGEFEQEGPFITSLRFSYRRATKLDNSSTANDGNTINQARAIIRTTNRNYDVATIVNKTNENKILQELFSKANLSTVNTCKTIGDPKANEKIYLFDKSIDEKLNFKIGFIYQRSNQINESEILSNDEENISNNVFEFLNNIADRIRLKSFNKFRGDLDITDDLHGEYSYYTEFQNYEIMFNVAPMIPSTKANGQCVERKGLVGNSFVCIVFQETNSEFTPDWITGKVTQVFITVKPIMIDEQLHYKIGVWRRKDVTTMIDPPGGIYQFDESFRDYFLTLLLNSMNAALESSYLRSRILEQRRRIKLEEIRKLTQNLSIGQIFDCATDFETVGENICARSSSESERLSKLTTLPKNGIDDKTRSGSKPRNIKNILGRLTGRSIAASLPSDSLINNDTSSSNSISTEIITVQKRTDIPDSREPIRRTASVKSRRAPVAPPPIRQNTIGTIRSHPSLASPNGLSISNFSDFTNTLPIQNNRSNMTTMEHGARSRSNSSPSEGYFLAPKLQSLTVSKINEENCDTNDVEENVFEELINEEKPDDMKQ